MITLKIPDAKTPGYLRRLIQAEQYRKQVDDGTVDYDGLIEFLLVFIIEPADRQEAKEMLLDLNFEQYRGLLAAIAKPGDDSFLARQTETN